MRKVVLVSLDALYDADLAWLGEDSFMGGLLRDSAVSTRVKTIFPALTYPTHVTMVTGENPAAHGIGHNRPYQPGVEPRLCRWYWEAEHIRVPTLFDAVKKAGGRSAAIFWPVTGKSRAIRWNLPEVIALPGENQVTKILSYGSGAWIVTAGLKYFMKMKDFHEPAVSDLGCNMACEVIRRHQPDFTALHFVDLDEMRHKHGAHSEEAKEALKRLDERVRRIWETMQTTRGMEDALLVVVSDHGQADVDKPVFLTEALEKAGVKAGVQSCGMSAYIYTEDPDAAGVLAGIEGVAHVYDRGELDKLGCPSNVSLAVEAAPGVVFADGMPQALHEKATHGYGPGHEAENCLFAVHGKGIEHGVLPEMAMKDMAPTIAGLMGIPFPAAGRSVASLVMGRKSGESVQ